MKYISSDTNIWIDFYSIQRLELPFRLDYTFLMSKEVLERELHSPVDLLEKLIEAGLKQIEIDEKEYFLAIEYRSKYHRLSIADAVSLAIAKNRSIILLSGDGALRKAAQTEGVPIKGTIWLFDELLSSKLISSEEYLDAMLDLKKQQEYGRRLPIKELDIRIQHLKSLKVNTKTEN